MSQTGKAGESSPRHPIGVVAERTGLSPDVIRVWERRYGVVEPSRDAGGNRLYTDAEVARLELLGRAVEGGRSIGRIADLSDEAVAELVRSDAAARWRTARPPSPAERSSGSAAAGGGAAGVVERAFELTRALDAAGLEELLERAALVLGVRVFLEGVAAPLLRRVGDAWHAGVVGVAHEHMASGVTVSLLGRLRSRLPATAGAPLIAVGTPAGERHEVGALLASATAASEGWRVLYLGPDLPGPEIATAADAAGARAVALSVVRQNVTDEMAEAVRAVAEPLRGRADVLLGGAGAEGLRERLSGSGVVLLDGLGALEEYLRRGGGRP